MNIEVALAMGDDLKYRIMNIEIVKELPGSIAKNNTFKIMELWKQY